VVVFLYFSPLVKALIENIKLYQTLKTMFNQNQDQDQIGQKYSVTHHIFISLVCVWKCFLMLLDSLHLILNVKQPTLLTEWQLSLILLLFQSFEVAST